MARIVRFNEFRDPELMGEEFLEIMLNPQINESVEESKIIEILKSLSKDLKFNTRLIFTFGTGIAALYPVVTNLIKNGSIKMEMTPENIVLLTLTALTITYLEETNNKVGDTRIVCDECDGSGEVDDVECEVCKGEGYLTSVATKKDAQTMLEELKLRGVGNGIVKKFVGAFKSIGKLVGIILRGTPYVVKGIMDMFGYTALLVPTMNAIAATVGNYDVNVDNIIGNVTSLGVGIGIFLGKQAVNYLVDKLKKNLHIKLPKASKNLDIYPKDIVDSPGGFKSDHQLQDAEALVPHKTKLIKDNTKHR